MAKRKKSSSSKKSAPKKRLKACQRRVKGRVVLKKGYKYKNGKCVKVNKKK